MCYYLLKREIDISYEGTPYVPPERVSYKPILNERSCTMKRKNTFPFTASMRRFDDASGDVENFYTIHGTTVVFNSDLVDSFTMLPVVDSNSIGVRLHNQDGTCIDRLFSMVDDKLCEVPPTTPPIPGIAIDHHAL